MWAYRIAGRSVSRPVCGKYRIAVSLREGFFLLKKETDSKAINALPSVWISCFPSVGHLLYGYFMCANLKYASFFGSILSKYERKIVPKTVCRLNLQVSKTVRTFLCTHWGMNAWWEFTKRYVWMKFSIMPILTIIHTFVRTHIHKQNAVSWFGSEFVHYTPSYLVCSQCIQSKG